MPALRRRCTGAVALRERLKYTMSPDNRPLTQVAVGIVHNAAGQVLFAQRPAGKPYAGWWEFPGGKLEAGESLALALARELREELGIQIHDCHHWLTQRFVYPHAHVNLQLCHVRSFGGQPQSLEGQAFVWGRAAQPPLPFLPAALPVLKAMQLPDTVRLSAAAQMGLQAWSAALNTLPAGVVVVHEPDAAPELAASVLHHCQQWQSAASAAQTRTVLVSSRMPQHCWGLADGVLLTERDLLACQQRPSVNWVFASVHSRAALDHAAALGCHAALLGTVLPSASHPAGTAGRDTLGWGRLGDVLADTCLATYALGGLLAQHLPLAQAAGAAGIAMKRGGWKALTEA
jgi:8-oxo-dGTP diphosphatase